MPCSAYTLSMATVCAVVSVALIAIAFGTDNWQHIQVERVKIERELARSDIKKDEFDRNSTFYTRTKGLFRMCYPEKQPLRDNHEELYLSPIETWCENIDYYITDEENLTSHFSEDQMTRLHMARSMIALFLVSFCFVFVAFWTGVAGCWRRSPGNIGSTAIIMLFACLFAAGGMGLWHGVEYYENEKLSSIHPYRGSWPELLRSNSHTTYDWSYFLAWIGVCWSLVAALMFAGASVCLRSEKKREDAKNMAYLMPVYPQKNQYGAPSYGYGYPGPYHYGTHSQYGHYNY